MAVRYIKLQDGEVATTNLSDDELAELGYNAISTSEKKYIEYHRPITAAAEKQRKESIEKENADLKQRLGL